jgi:type I restriction enzyme S subunit
MSFPRYPAYKDSGVEWLGEVPEHWEISKLGYVCQFESGKAHEPFIAEDGSFICVNSRFVSTQGEKAKMCSVNLTPAHQQDILMVMSDLPNGRALAKAFFVDADNKYAVNQRVCRIQSINEHPRFLYYLLDRNPGLLWFDDGANQTHIPNSGFTKLSVLLPPYLEQVVIATFLDRETAKIDALIAEQQRLIELLQEKRQAVISHAVTKGLNPNAPMKDSGVEWLGEVPEHWEVMNIRHLLQSLSQGSSPSCLQDPAEEGQYGVLKVGCVNQLEFLPDENKCLPEDVAPDLASAVQPGDVLMSRGNTKELVGLAAVVPDGIEHLLASDLIFVLRFKLSLALPEFIAIFLRSDLGRCQIEPQTVGTSASMQKINQSTIKGLVVALPPVEEQRKISESINHRLKAESGYIRQSSLAIELLKERRQALISAAVTGQIDVRGLVPEEAE